MGVRRFFELRTPRKLYPVAADRDLFVHRKCVDPFIQRFAWRARNSKTTPPNYLLLSSFVGQGSSYQVLILLSLDQDENSNHLVTTATTTTTIIAGAVKRTKILELQSVGLVLSAICSILRGPGVEFWCNKRKGWILLPVIGKCLSSS